MSIRPDAAMSLSWDEITPGSSVSSSSTVLCVKFLVCCVLPQYHTTAASHESPGLAIS